MSDILTSATTEQTADIPDYPMAREPRCPFAPPPDVMALAESRPLSRVRIWDGSTPWLITGYEQVRELFSDSRVSVDDRVPGFPHWNEGMLSTVHKRPRSVFTSDGEEHTRFRRMLSKPFTFRRVEVCARRSSRSPTTTSTRCWPARSPRMSLPPLRFRFRRW